MSALTKDSVFCFRDTTARQPRTRNWGVEEGCLIGRRGRGRFRGHCYHGSRDPISAESGCAEDCNRSPVCADEQVGRLLAAVDPVGNGKTECNPVWPGKPNELFEKL